MTKKIAIASGKGGTGKTTVSVNLFHYLHTQLQKDTILVDCDVEEPNATLFFTDKETIENKTISVKIPEFNTAKCTFCKLCTDYCEFNAISLIATAQFIELNKDLCHSCGACSFACKSAAIKEVNDPIGTVALQKVSSGELVAEGRLNIGSALQTTLISKLKQEYGRQHEYVLFDAPPGNSCPVVETVEDTDYVVLVTEPTPFGLHDLKITVALLREMQKDFGVVVNKAGIGSKEIYQYLEQEDIPLLGEIPFDKNYAAQYAGANLFSTTDDRFTDAYKHITSALIKSLEK